MGIAPSVPSEGDNNDLLATTLLGDAYANVKLVADNLASVIAVAENIDDLVNIAAIAATVEAHSLSAAASASAASTSADQAEIAAAIAQAAIEGIDSPALPAATRAILAGLPTAFPVILTEEGREGIFVFETGNHSTKVATDTQQGIYVAPTSDPTGASGAWVRKYSGMVNVRWFGAVGDGVTNDGPVFIAALALLKAISVNQVAGWYQASTALYVPAGHYFLDVSTLDITHTVMIMGDGSGLSTGASKLRWAGNTTGIRVQRYNTTGDDDTVAAGYNAGDGSVFRDLWLVGSGSLVEGEYHGFHLRAMVHIDGCKVEGFQGDGIHSNVAAGGSPEGAANLARLTNTRSWGNRKGLFLDGADTNAWTISSCDFSHNRTWGVDDSSFLGNSYDDCHAAANGWDGALGSTPTACTYLGKRYAVKVGQAVWCGNNAPTGTTADNQGWLYLQAGGVYNGVAEWVGGGQSFREGGAYKTDNANAANKFDDCYSEGDQNCSQFAGTTMIIHGLHGANYRGGAKVDAHDSYSRFNKLKVVDPATDYGLVIEQPNAVLPYGRFDFLTAAGAVGLQGWGTSLFWTVLGSGAPTNWSFELLLDGTGNPVGSRKMHFPNGFGIGERKVLPGTAAPVAGEHQAGDRVINTAPTPGSPIEWVCVAWGNPGTWVAVYTADDTAYGAGWNGSLKAPTANAVYDKIESIVASIISGVIFQTTWDASTNTPAIPAAAAGNKGHYYRVSVAGTTSIDGIADWGVGDWIVSNGTTWDKIDNSESVTSVAGLSGAVTGAALKTAMAFVKGDVGLGNVDNTSDVDKPVSTAQQTALDGKSNARPAIDTNNASVAAADGWNNSHRVLSGGGTPTLTLGNLTAGTSFSTRVTTAWAVACAGGVSKNGAAPTGVTTANIAANSLVTFLHEGAGVWVISGGGIS